MPIAKPAAIEKILYHMANVGNLTRSAVRNGEMIPGRFSELTSGQQRLPLYPEKFMKDFDQVTGAMSEKKLGLIADNLISPEDYKQVRDWWPNEDYSVYHAKPTPDGTFKGGVALMGDDVLLTGPAAIAHEGRHLEVYKDIFNTGGEQPVFDPSNVVRARTKPGVFEGKEITDLYSSDANTVLSRPSLDELDASMSEIGTLAKAGHLENIENSPYASKAGNKIRKAFWNLLPPKAQQHYIETAALAGIAAPSIGAFQPETKNK